MKLLLTGAPMTATEAAACGLVSELVADDEVEQRAVTLAAQLELEKRAPNFRGAP